MILALQQALKDDGVILIKGSCPGSEGDYIIVRESKKVPIGSARHKQILDHRKPKDTGDKKDAKKGADKGAAAAKKK